MRKLFEFLIIVSTVTCLQLETAIADLKSETETDVRTKCQNAISEKGYKGYQFERTEFNESLSNYSLTGQINNGSKCYEFNCVVSTKMAVTDLAINPLAGGGNTQSGAPAEAQVACANEADKYWQLMDGTAIPLSSTATGGGMFEVKLSGNDRRGICTVTEDGDVKFIMNE